MVITLKLDPAVVQPAVDLIWNQEAILEKELAKGPSKEMELNLNEVRILLSLFHSEYLDTGQTTIGEDETPAILRACSFLRLQLRHSALSGASDEFLESGLDPNLDSIQDRGAAKCYLFLALLQAAILQGLRTPLRGFDRFIEWGWHFSFPKKKFPQDAAAPKLSDSWQVVVLNDPVNLREYVIHVFRAILGVSKEIAEQRTSEVHEQKSAIVWEGQREQANDHVRTLQSWHLSAVLRQSDPRA